MVDMMDMDIVDMDMVNMNMVDMVDMALPLDLDMALLYSKIQGHLTCDKSWACKVSLKRTSEICVFVYL